MLSSEISVSWEMDIRVSEELVTIDRWEDSGGPHTHLKPTMNFMVLFINMGAEEATLNPSQILMKC